MPQVVSNNWMLQIAGMELFQLVVILLFFFGIWAAIMCIVLRGWGYCWTRGVQAAQLEIAQKSPSTVVNQPQRFWQCPRCRANVPHPFPCPTCGANPPA